MKGFIQDIVQLNPNIEDQIILCFVSTLLQCVGQVQCMHTCRSMDCDAGNIQIAYSNYRFRDRIFIIHNIADRYICSYPSRRDYMIFCACHYPSE